jgi:hypothetical protein
MEDHETELCPHDVPDPCGAGRSISSGVGRPGHHRHHPPNRGRQCARDARERPRLPGQPEPPDRRHEHRRTKAGPPLPGADEHPVLYKVVTNGNYSLLLSNLPPGTVIRFRSGAGETNDTLKIPKAKSSAIDFGTNDYSSTDAAGNPTVFRAGVGNDSGLVVAQVDATSLSDLSPGSVASTLYTGLSLNPPNGVSIGLSGSVIQFTYAPGSTDVGGGRVVFGTSSGQGELEGAMAVPDQFPVFTSLSVVSRTNVIVRGANGLEGTICLVLSSTNLALPATNWTALATNVIGSSGTFTNTFIRAPDDSRRFYRLQVPITLP